MLFSYQSHAKKLLLVAAEASVPTSYELDGKQKGILIEVINEVFARAGYAIEIELKPWARCLKEVKHGIVDGIFSAFVTPERQSYLTYTNEILIMQSQAFFVPLHSTITFDGDLKKMSNLSIGVINKTSYGPILDKALKDGMFNRIEIAQSSKSNLLKLIAGRIDLIPSYRHVVLSTAKTLGLEDSIKQLNPTVESIPSYLAFSKNKDFSQVIIDYDNTLKSMKQDGSYDKIFKQYF
tara:strand:- start:34 stop:744 length:711 start_codon:yes stop_codon:yes gene_type:complete